MIKELIFEGSKLLKTLIMRNRERLLKMLGGHSCVPVAF
jgi:hypothetical protein